MKRRILLLVCVGLLAIAGKVVAQQPSDGQKPADEAARLQRQIDQLSERVRLLEYPEMRKRSRSEIQILKKRVQSAEVTQGRINKLRITGLRGGDRENWAYSNWFLANARVELAWATRDVHGAVRHATEAVVFARWQEAAAKIGYEVNRSTFELLLESQAAHTDAQLALIRAKKTAGVMKVDVSDICMADIEKRLKTEDDEQHP